MSKGRDLDAKEDSLVTSLKEMILLTKTDNIKKDNTKSRGICLREIVRHIFKISA